MDHSNLWTDITGEGPHVWKTLQKYPFCVPLGRQRGTVGHHSGGKVPSFHYKCITTLCTAAPQHTAGVLLISFTPAPQISQVIHCLSHTRGHDQSLMYKNIDCHFNWNHWPVIQSSKTLILEYWLRIVLRAYDRADKYNNHDKRVNESVPRCASHPFLSSTSPPPSLSTPGLYWALFVLSTHKSHADLQQLCGLCVQLCKCERRMNGSPTQRW